MLLKKYELLMSLYARGHNNIMNFDGVQPETDDEAPARYRARLLELELLETDPENPAGYRYSAYGQVILDTIGQPDAWVEVLDPVRGFRRCLFLRDAFYICVEELGEEVAVDLLPSLPIFIGGYASMLTDLRDLEPGEAAAEDWTAEAQLLRAGVYSGDESLVLEISPRGVARETTSDAVTYRRHSQESCTNAITQWMLHALKRKEVAAQ